MVESTQWSQEHDLGKIEACYCLQESSETCLQGTDKPDEGMVVRIKQDVLHCESEYNRGAGCGKTARPDLHGGLYVNEVPTITIFL